MVLVKLCTAFAVVCAVFASVAVGASTSSTHQKRRAVVYSNHFAVHVPDGKEAADALADKHGFVNNGQVGFLLKLIIEQIVVPTVIEDHHAKRSVLLTFFLNS